MSEFTPFELAVHDVLVSLRRGEIMTHGEVALEAGHPGAARAVGSFLRDHSGHPWWRVIAANGWLVSGLERDHAARLTAEGVAIDNGRFCMH